MMSKYEFDNMKPAYSEVHSETVFKPSLCRSIPGHKIGGLSAHPLPDDVDIKVLDNGVMIFTGNITPEMKLANAKEIAEHEVGVAVANGFGQED